jgi:ribosome-associated heat shock protein Hsp15
MRIDQFLWCIRLFKSRNMASNACKKGQVQINNQSVKPSRVIIPTDHIQLRKNQLWRSFEVLDLPKTRVGAKLVGLYCLETSPTSLLEQEELQKLSATITRDQGTGRPTKKDRRDIDDLFYDEINED